MTSQASEPEAAEDEGRWYAIWTRSRHEANVCLQLDEKEIEAFLPTVKKWSRWKDRKKQIDWPLFPGYCFARFDAQTRLRVLKCSGVVSIVSIDGEPAPIPDEEIDAIRRLVESDFKYDPCPLLTEGMKVEVSAVLCPKRSFVGLPSSPW